MITSANSGSGFDRCAQQPSKGPLPPASSCANASSLSTLESVTGADDSAAVLALSEPIGCAASICFVAAITCAASPPKLSTWRAGLASRGGELLPKGFGG